MFGASAKISQKPDFGRSLKNFNFGVATGLTQTAKDAQAASQDSLKSTFTLRGRWFEQSNKFGIKVKPATKTKLQAEVHTLADWLKLHEEGGEKTPRGNNLAIPTNNVRRNKRQIITKGMRPGALRDKKNIVVVESKKGPVIYQRKGRGKNAKLVALYILEPKARIKKRSTFYGPVNQAIAKNLMPNITAGIRKAFATAR